MICPRCGNQIDDTVKFCPVCGGTIAAAAGRAETYAGAVYNKEDNFETTERKTGQNGFAIASLVMSLVAVPFGFILLIPSILAIIFGIVGISKSSAAGSGRAMSVAGLIIGAVAAILWIALMAIGISLLGVVISIMNF